MIFYFDKFPSHITAENLRSNKPHPDKRLIRAREQITKILEDAFTFDEPKSQQIYFGSDIDTLNYDQIKQIDAELRERGFSIGYGSPSSLTFRYIFFL